MIRRLARWGHFVLHVLGLVAVLGMLGVIVFERNLRFDLTPERKFTLSQHAEQILDRLDRDVNIIAFTRGDDNRNIHMKDLFWRVRERQPRVAWRIVDVNRNPSLAREYGADAYGAVVVESGGRRKNFSNVTREDVLMAAILQVTRAERKIVYFLTGHGEHDIEDSGRRKGYTTIRSVLMDEFYEVQKLSLVSQPEVPEDADVLVIAGPRTDLLAEELHKIGAYLERGGGILALLEPDSSPSLNAFLTRWRMRFPDALVADGDNAMAQGEPLTMRVADPTDYSLITTRLIGDPVFSLSRPIEILEDDRQASFATRAILRTGKEAWTIPSRTGQIAGATDFDPSRGDVRGQQVLGAQVVIEVDGEVPDDAVTETGDAPRPTSRIVVLGDSDFADNFFVELLGNKDLFVNSVNWLAKEDELIAIRPQKKPVGREQLFLSGRQSYWSFMNFTVFQPLAVLAVGGIVFAWRKLR